MEVSNVVCVSRIQQVDGGFFEKFGSLFREQAEYANAQEQIEQQRVAKVAEQIIPEKTEDEGEIEALPTIDSDASSLSSDSENEVEKEATDLIATALNVSKSIFFVYLITIYHNFLFCGKINSLISDNKRVLCLFIMK